jgi:predicted glycosyltransferase
VTTGGGGDGYKVMETYLSMLESYGTDIPYKSILITGPFMPKQDRKKIFKRAKKLKIRTFHFYRNMEKLMAAADVVVTMGGYNTLCEILSLKTISLIVPRDNPRKEQLIRAQILNQHGLADYLTWRDCNPAAMREKIHSLLNNPRPYHEAISKFQMTGIQTMCNRLQSFRTERIDTCLAVAATG